MDNYFCAKNLFRVWDSVTVDFSFTAVKGTMTVIVGKSGSGKSTVLRLIAGLEEPIRRNDRKACVITLAGKELSKLAPRKRGIGMVFQSPALFSHLTVAGNVAYALRCKGIGKKKAEAEAERFRKAAESSIEQAGRNTLIAFRQGVLHELEALVNMETAQSYNAEVLKTLIPETVKLWIKNNNTDDLSVILSPQDLKKLESSLHSALKDAVSNGLEIKADGKMSGGFRIGTKNGEAYYDFSAESVAGLFSSYLSPKTSEILKQAAKEL